MLTNYYFISFSWEIRSIALFLILSFLSFQRLILYFLAALCIISFLLTDLISSNSFKILIFSRFSSIFCLIADKISYYFEATSSPSRQVSIFLRRSCAPICWGISFIYLYSKLILYLLIDQCILNIKTRQTIIKWSLMSNFSIFLILTIFSIGQVYLKQFRHQSLVGCFLRS